MDEEKDKKIQELTGKLRVRKRLSTSYHEQLEAFVKEVEDHNYDISMKVQRTLDNLKRFDAEAKELLSGLEFESAEDARELYEMYGRRMSFTIRNNRTRRSLKDNSITGREFVCSKEGFRVEKCTKKGTRVFQSRPATREGCDAMLRIAAKDWGKWVIYGFIKEHTHELNPSKIPPRPSHQIAFCEAAKSQEPASKAVCGLEVCGNVSIKLPFGKETGCYTNSWFQVTCNKIVDGLKPFINRLMLEILDFTSVSVVNNPVTYVHCPNRNGSITSTNLKGSPFVFSSSYNFFGSVGCGNLATLFGNRTDHVSGCLQTMCDDGASKSGCFVTINEDLTSYTVNMTPFYTNGTGEGDSKRCTSAFLYDMIKPLCQGPATAPLKSKRSRTCGTVDIEYPFGIEQGDYIDDRFRVTCEEINNKMVPYIQSINLQQLQNIFWSPGYGNLATVFDYQTGHPIGCCLQQSCGTNEEVSSVNGCFVYLPHGLNSFTANMTKFDSSNSSNGSCEFASVVYNDFINVWNSNPDLRGLTHIPATLQWGTPMSGWIEPYSDLSSDVCLGCTTIGTIFMLLGTWRAFKVHKRRQNVKLKQKYFKRNGGLLLHSICLTTQNRILGQGTVYKGMLTDGSIVAIKKSRLVEGKKVEQFINEVIILSQINHRNVAFEYGLFPGLALSALEHYVLKGKSSFTLKHGKPDHEATNVAMSHSPIEYPKPDGVLSLDVPTSLHRSNTNHNHDQPAHLHLRDLNIPETVNLPLYAGPESRY
ncbi:Far-red impaired responsive family protein isoform 1 [Hibiscus syriacus]|uniref:Far-red impaired responsive family protein isoform 1 n=1 Tax=Hibiscus syriacus TaxID=106335 RepID=A0A6A2ZWD9_HIBSY|nr:Far-red impaired responsive family protein isoform 1 [Hibiscus syriacus]